MSSSSSRPTSTTYRRRLLLTPFQGALIHIVLIGLPTRFGILQTHPFGNKFVSELPSLCFFYEQDNDNDASCLPVDEFLIQDYGYRFVSWYTLALVACFIIRKTGGDANNLGLRRLNRTLIVVTFLNLLGLAWLQHFQHDAKLDSDYFSLVVLNSLLAIAISTWVCQPTSIPTSKKPAKWSMPAMALFAELSANAVVVVASVQVWKSRPQGLAQYLDSSVVLSSRSTTTFVLATLQSLLTIILLKSLRDFMTWQQLKAVCLFKLISSLVVALVWYLPEQSSFVKIQHAPWILTARVGLTLLYLIGYLLAGTADSTARILSSEKDE